MSFDNHDRCRRCGADDTASHTPTECARILRERAEARRAHDVAHGASRCGHAGVCAWMRDAIGECNTGNARNVVFARRELKHPDTLRMVARVQMAIGLREPDNVRACPACGGDPNEPEPVTR